MRDRFKVHTLRICYTEMRSARGTDHYTRAGCALPSQESYRLRDLRA